MLTVQLTGRGRPQMRLPEEPPTFRKLAEYISHMKQSKVPCGIRTHSGEGQMILNYNSYSDKVYIWGWYNQSLLNYWTVLSWPVTRPDVKFLPCYFSGVRTNTVRQHGHERHTLGIFMVPAVDIIHTSVTL